MADPGTNCSESAFNVSSSQTGCSHVDYGGGGLLLVPAAVQADASRANVAIAHFEALALPTSATRGKMESDASACAGTADDNRNHNHGQHQNQDLQQLPTTAAAAHTVAVFQFIVGQTESFV
ncbi:hypothetical protein U1Q18_050769 [Sarracenia purpurea var. burkii]